MSDLNINDLKNAINTSLAPLTSQQNRIKAYEYIEKIKQNNDMCYKICISFITLKVKFFLIYFQWNFLMKIL